MLLSLRGIRKTFDGVVALDGVSLDIDEGEFVCFLGPSGCGKTTLLRIVAGLETPDAAELRLADRDLLAIPARERNFGIVFQSYSLFPNMTVARNIAYGLECRAWKRDDIAPRVAAMLDLVNLAELSARLPHQLSGGQQQRVALARALAPGPRVLLLDEPLSALDAKLREETRLELVELQARLGISFVFVTHDQDEAMAISDRIGVMQGGRIVQIGAPAEIYDRPATRFVAEFVGRINLFRSGEGWVAVRPERVRLGEGAHVGTVRECAFLGERRLVFIDAPQGRVTASVSGSDPVPENGASVPFGWPADAERKLPA